MKYLAFLGMTFLATLLLAGCGGSGGAAPTAAIVGTPGTSATLRIDPNPPTPMQEATLELTLRDGQGRAILGASVQLDLTMPGMQMPVNQPQVTEVGRGVYRARAMFTMAGEWEVRADVNHGGEQLEFTFPLRTK